MNEYRLAGVAATHQLYRLLLDAFRVRRDDDDVDVDRDRGAVSLEQVLWFVAAGISVAVISTLIWNTIFDEANKTPTVPQAPTGSP